MANISVETIRLKSGSDWKKKITYSKGMFRIKLPEEMCADMNIVGIEKEIHGNSESDVNKLFDQKMKDWQEAIEIITKVILFEAKFQGALLKKEKWKDWSDGKYKPYSATNTNSSKSQGVWEFIEHQISFSDCPHLGLMFAWGVYEKKDTKGKVKFKFISGRDLPLSYWGKDEYIEIEYTKDREKFFLELDLSFATMIAKVYKALGELTPEKLSALADSKTKLLTQ